MKRDVRTPGKMHSINGRSSNMHNKLQANALSSLKKICFLLIFAGTAAVFNSCEVGWVATEPSYNNEIERPVRPGNDYIWIEGDWRWDHGRNHYEREPGYWARPRPMFSYVCWL